ncbi:MAG: DUF1223 domain-containing protein [Rhodospirillales bacterium]|nr:DUF1223 domain-containing protein [Alphaproteobacteria bacterium]MBL6947100.1 DUF1223 domain-containing protein [Rhodospirillales bacterium]
MNTHIKTLVLAATLAVGIPFSTPFSAQAGNAPLILAELFTSQGCSSCPPADAFLGELAKRDDVLALSVHVDYWDYIGWKDPFASPENTRRQRQYGKFLGLRYIYTPQLVIDGADHVTGSDRARVLEKITKAAKSKRLAVGIKRDGEGLRVNIPAGGPGDVKDRAAVWVVLFDDRHDTEIKRGENSGRTLSYYNVVQAMTRIGTWTGKAMEIRAGLSELPAKKADNGAVILQSLNTGRILGVARVALKKS